MARLAGSVRAISGPPSCQTANRHRLAFPLHYRKWPVYGPPTLCGTGHVWPAWYLQMRRPAKGLLFFFFFLYRLVRTPLAIWELLTSFILRRKASTCCTTAKTKSVTKGDAMRKYNVIKHCRMN